MLLGVARLDLLGFFAGVDQHISNGYVPSESRSATRAESWIGPITIRIADFQERGALLTWDEF